MLLDPKAFATVAGVSDRRARKIFAEGHWHGFVLPVVQLPGHRGGKGGAVWALAVDRCAPELQAKLMAVEPAFEEPVKGALKGRVDDRHIEIAQDKARIVAPCFATPKGSLERAQAIRALAAQNAHKIGGELVPVAERTLREWIAAGERGLAELLPRSRSDRGQRRVRITRAWDKGCGLPDEVQERLAAKMEATARGLFIKGRSERSVAKLSAVELQKLTAQEGFVGTADRLKQLCKLNSKWTGRFRDAKFVHTFEADNKKHTDKHEFHVKRGLTARPMEVLMGDVHTVDLTIAEAMASRFSAVRAMAFDQAVKGEVSVKAWLIGWMDGSSGYMWATPVITGPGQGITQRDVALSLYDVLTCPFGGMPVEFMIDNGGEFGFLFESVVRFAAMAELSGLGVVKCRPYHPEGKARLEGAFGVIEKGFVSALPGYNGGNILRRRLKGRGTPVAPYDRGPDRLVEDLCLAVAQYNGTAQHGDLDGYSPKQMLETKAEATVWQAQRIDPNDDVMFDLIFSREVRRDVRQGTVTFGDKLYSGPILAEMIGEKQVPILIPYRDPDGPAILFRDGVVHRLTAEVFALNDREGAVRKGEMVKLQKEEIARRKAKADTSVDVQQLLSDAADLEPVKHNAPATWSMGVIDKGGFLVMPISAEEATASHEAEVRDFMEEYLAGTRPRKREADGGNRQTSLNAT